MENPGTVPGQGDGACLAGPTGPGLNIPGPDGTYRTISSPRYEKARLALIEAWEHRPPACSWERAVFEKMIMPDARAELQAAWLEAAEMSGFVHPGAGPQLP